MEKQAVEPLARLICGLIARSREDLERAQEAMSQTWGKIASESEIWSFNHTRYYEKEMGKGLLRQFLAFIQPIRQDSLAQLKLTAMAMERELGEMEGGELHRRVNIDPGYLDLNKLVLASNKNYSHRIYLGDGIYAEVTLIYRHGGFQPLEWTYPDYRTPKALEFFNRVREEFKMLRRQSSRRGGEF